MPLFETQEKNGRILIRLKVHQLIEEDIKDYGPIERSDKEMEERAQYHIAQMRTHLPTPETALVDDEELFTSIMIGYYAIAYKAFLIASTSFQEPFALRVEPRYTTSVKLDDTETEYEFGGLIGLLTIIKDAQDIRRKNALEDGRDSNEYLLSLVQVTVYDAQEDHRARHEKSQHFVCYEVDVDRIGAMSERQHVSEEVLRGLGLPCTPRPASEASDTYTTD